jgi:hypothetical protein
MNIFSSAIKHLPTCLACKSPWVQYPGEREREREREREKERERI